MARARKAAKATILFFENPRNITEKMIGYDSVHTNGNASWGIVKAGKVGHRISQTYGQRSVNGFGPDVKAMVESMTGQPLPADSPLQLAIDACRDRDNG